MKIFIIIAVIGFLSHVATLILYGAAYFFSNRNVYESHQRMSFLDERLTSFSIMVLGIAGWIAWKLSDSSYLISSLIGITAALLAEIIGVVISEVYNTTMILRYRRLFSEMLRSDKPH